ncbi:MAG: nitroreductase family protein [Candidatus Kariarchaeaceae archaeon]|jgi:nitroreductase
MVEHPHIPYQFTPLSEEESRRNAENFYRLMDRRRSCRFFSDKDVPFEIIEHIIHTAGTSPSGAHQQPWTYVVIGKEDMELRRKIREAAEEEERISYEGRMSEEWLEALAPLGTDWQKPFLETAPYLVVVFRQRYGIREDGESKKHYYSSESVGISVGLAIAAIHNAGLVTLTHTPSPMNFLKKILGRPENEVPFVVLPIGYPATGATVPDIHRKPLDEIMVTKGV